MESMLLIIQIVLAVAMIGMVLIQRSDADGFGMGSGSGTGLLSGRSKASFMTRTTAVLATLFMINSLAFSIIVSRSSAVNLVDDVAKEMKKEGAVNVGADAKKDAPMKAPLADMPVASPVTSGAAVKTETSKVDVAPVSAPKADASKPVEAPKAVVAPKVDASKAVSDKKAK